MQSEYVVADSSWTVRWLTSGNEIQTAYFSVAEAIVDVFGEGDAPSIEAIKATHGVSIQKHTERSLVITGPSRRLLHRAIAALSFALRDLASDQFGCSPTKYMSLISRSSSYEFAMEGSKETGFRPRVRLSKKVEGDGNDSSLDPGFVSLFAALTAQFFNESGTITSGLSIRIHAGYVRAGEIKKVGEIFDHRGFLDLLERMSIRGTGSFEEW